MTEHVQIILPTHVNAVGRLFGGQLMAWIDVVAAVEARRHCKCEATTVSVDNLMFIRPAFVNDILRIEATLTWTGRTSLEVRVDTYVEPLEGKSLLVNRAYLAFVALDTEGKPRPICAFVPKTYEEKHEWRMALERREFRLKHKAMHENYR
jgi:acyl-CoA hydrolase